MNRFLLAAILLLCGLPPALAQSVQQSGSVTTGHVPAFATSNVIYDGGTATAGKINSLGLYGNGGTPFCITNSATPAPFATSYSQLCLGVSSAAGYITLNSYGSATQLPLDLIVNGTTVPLLTSYDASFTTTNSTLALASIPSGEVLGNATSSAAEPTAATLTALMDKAFGSTEGALVTRGASTWNLLAPGTSGTYLQSQGSSALLQWNTPSISLGTVYTSTSGNPTITSAMFILVVNNASPTATTVYLPASPTSSYICVVKDGAGVAQSYPITVSGNGNTIDGGSSVQIRTNYGAMNFAWNGSTWNVW